MSTPVRMRFCLVDESRTARMLQALISSALKFVLQCSWFSVANQDRRVLILTTEQHACLPCDVLDFAMDFMLVGRAGMCAFGFWGLMFLWNTLSV